MLKNQPYPSWKNHLTATGIMYVYLNNLIVDTL